MAKDYPTAQSIIEIIFNDGEIKQYRMSASSGISAHLAREAANGILSFRYGEENWAIPTDNIRQWRVWPDPEFKPNDQEDK
jgi:hypothetical protein